MCRSKYFYDSNKLIASRNNIKNTWYIINNVINHNKIVEIIQF